MALLLSVTAHLVTVDLSDSGLLRVHPHNPAAAIAWLGLYRNEDVVLSPDQVEAIHDMAPLGILTGWVDLVTTGHTLRIPYRERHQPFMRALLREMQEHGYPARSGIGQREPEPALV